MAAKAKKYIVAILCIVLSFSGAVMTSAKTISEQYDASEFTVSGENINQSSYLKVLKKWRNEGFAEAKDNLVVFEAGLSDAILDGKSCISQDDDTANFNIEFDVPVKGLYNIEIEYHTMGGTGLPIQRAVRIDGNTFFIQAQTTVLYRYFGIDPEQRYNARGDQLVSPSEEKNGWYTSCLYDVSGTYDQPLLWAFSKGHHSLNLEFVAQPMAISAVRLTAPYRSLSYDTVKNNYKQQGLKNATTATLLIQTEDADSILWKTDSTLAPFSDKDPLSQPVADKTKIFNALGGNMWSSGNQQIAYKVIVPEDGLYKMALRVLQKWNGQTTSFRRIEIDGEVPFKELLEYGFSYSRNWNTETLSADDGTPFLFYLTEGEHIVSFTSVIHPAVSEAVELIQDAGDNMSELYRLILLITGAEPDLNYEYELHKSIPNLLDKMQEIIDLLNDARELLRSIGGESSASDSNLKMVIRQISDMRKKPTTIAWRLDDWINAITTLGNLTGSVKYTPLAIDYFYFCPPDAKVENRHSGFFARLFVILKDFLYSFSDDYYSSEADSESSDTLDVWVSIGKEWAVIMEQQIKGDFEKNFNIKVNLNILPSGTLAGSVNPLLLAETSGNGPDAALNIGLDQPVEYGVRKMAFDISAFADFEEVKARFQPQILDSFTFLGKTYGLPETMNFYTLIYRKDIFEALNLAVPDTWDDVYYKLLPILYQNNMQMQPVSFDTYLYQFGGAYYNAEGTRTALDSAEAHAAFGQYIDQFHDLGFPITSNFFNRFRTGEMPIGFADYATYMQITTAAPELASRWALAPLPGTVKTDGEIDRSSTPLAATANMILADSDQPEKAWEFLKWWSSADVQITYGRALESTIGVSARRNTANIAAYDSLAWDKNDMKVIRKYWNDAKVVPNVLGGVIVTRAYSNASYLALYENYTPRKALEQAVDTISKELKRKQELYGVVPTMEGGGVQ